VAVGGAIGNGVDLWRTPGDGTSWLNLAEDPIPADFFCAGSAPYGGLIVWEGRPLATSPPDALGGADTIIYRLDDAVFDDKGVAVTRIRVEALSLVSSAPIQTRCGAYEVRASVAGGEQPVTEMRIERTDKLGGRFEAPLEFIVRLTFLPVGGKLGKAVELERQASFASGPGFFWSSRPLDLSKPAEKRAVLEVEGFVLVDTDGDDKADTFLPGTSNFFPYGLMERPEAGDKATVPVPVCQDGCHTDFGGGCHCPYPLPQQELN
jgi:hypothetical protein